MEQRSEENFLDKSIMNYVDDIRKAINKKNYSFDKVKELLENLKNNTKDDREFKKYLNAPLGVPKETVLFLATRWGKEDVVKYLLSKGADPHIVSVHYNSHTKKLELLKPVHACVHFDYMGILDVFRQDSSFGDLKDYVINDGKGTLGQFVLSAANENVWNAMYERFGAALFEEKNNFKSNAMVQGIFDAVLNPENNCRKLEYLFERNITILDNVDYTINSICIRHNKEDLILKLKQKFSNEKNRRNQDLIVHRANSFSPDKRPYNKHNASNPPSSVSDKVVDSFLKERRNKSIQNSIVSLLEKEIIPPTQKEISMRLDNIQTAVTEVTPMQIENAQPKDIIKKTQVEFSEFSSSSDTDDDSSDNSSDSSSDDDVPLAKRLGKQTSQPVVKKSNPSLDKNESKANSNTASQSKSTPQKRKKPDEGKDKNRAVKKSKSLDASKENQKIEGYSISSIKKCVEILKKHEKLVAEIGLIDTCKAIKESWSSPRDEKDLLAQHYQSNTEKRTVVKNFFTRLLVFKSKDGAALYAFLNLFLRGGPGNKENENIILVGDKESEKKDIATYGKRAKEAKTINRKIHKDGDVLVRRVTVDTLVKKIVAVVKWMQQSENNNNNLTTSAFANQQIETIESAVSKELEQQISKPAQATPEFGQVVQEEREPEPPEPFVYQPENISRVQEASQELRQEVQEERMPENEFVVSKNPVFGGVESSGIRSNIITLEDKNDIEDLKVERDRLSELLVEAQEKTNHATQEKNELKLTLKGLTNRYRGLKKTLQNNLEKARNSLDEKVAMRRQLEEQNSTLRSPDKHSQRSSINNYVSGSPDKFGQGSSRFHKSALSLPTSGASRTPIRGTSAPVLGSLTGLTPSDTVPKDSTP